jgi:hypothetical protein
MLSQNAAKQHHFCISPNTKHLHRELLFSTLGSTIIIGHGHSREERVMLHKSAGRLSRRSLLKSATAFGAAGLVGAGGASLFNVRRSLAAGLPDPASVLAKINVGN